MTIEQKQLNENDESIATDTGPVIFKSSRSEQKFIEWATVLASYYLTKLSLDTVSDEESTAIRHLAVNIERLAQRVAQEAKSEVNFNDGRSITDCFVKSLKPPFSTSESRKEFHRSMLTDSIYTGSDVLDQLAEEEAWLERFPLNPVAMQESSGIRAEIRALVAAHKECSGALIQTEEQAHLTDVVREVMAERATRTDAEKQAEQEKVEFYTQKLNSGEMTPNEVRTANGLTPLAGLDEKISAPAEKEQMPCCLDKLVLSFSRDENDRESQVKSKSARWKKEPCDECMKLILGEKLLRELGKGNEEIERVCLPNIQFFRPVKTATPSAAEDLSTAPPGDQTFGKVADLFPLPWSWHQKTEAETQQQVFCIQDAEGKQLFEFKGLTEIQLDLLAWMVAGLKEKNDE